MKSIEFTVLGVPAPKGSARAMMRAGKPALIASGSKANELNQLSWDNAVRAAAARAVASALAHDGSMLPSVYFGDVALRIQVVFRMKRLKSHFKKDGTIKPNAPKYHKTKPDKDKLIRCTQDSLKGIIVLDDSLFSEGYARKVYADPGREGAWIKIEQLEDT